MVSECEAQFLCHRLHSRFLQRIGQNDQAAYEILFVTFLGLSPEAGRHALSQPYLQSIVTSGLMITAGLAVAAVGVAIPNPISVAAAAGALGALKIGPELAKSQQKIEVAKTLNLLDASSGSRPLGFPAFSRILRRYARSKEIVELSLSTLETCSILFKKFIKQLIVAIEECCDSEAEKNRMMQQVDKMRSQQQQRLYESGILQTFSQCLTLTPATPDIGNSLLRAVNILHGIWKARKRASPADFIAPFTVECMRNLCARGMQTAVHRVHALCQQQLYISEVFSNLSVMRVHVDLLVHSLTLLQLLLSNSDDIQCHTRVAAEARIILTQLFQSHSLGFKQIFWMLLNGTHICCANDEFSCLKGQKHASWAYGAMFSAISRLESAAPASQEGCIQFGRLVGNSSLSQLQFMSMAIFFDAVSCSVDCGATAPLHAHHGFWRDDNSKPVCDKTCSHPNVRASGGHYRYETSSVG
jgi:hypothetical protein